MSSAGDTEITTGACLLDVTAEPGEIVSGICRTGQLLRVTTPNGHQVGDLCFFSLDDPTVGMDGPYTQMFAHHWRLASGMRILSRLCQPMWTIVEDDCGEHYTGGGLFRGDIASVVDRVPGLKMPLDGEGNRERIEREMGRFGMSPLCLDSANCFNAFMHVGYDADGVFEIRRSPAPPGARLTLEAMDTVLWIGCVNPFLGAINGDEPGPLRFQTFDRSGGAPV